MIHLIFVIVLILKTFSLDFINGDTCITPYQGNGTCVSTFGCDVINSALATFSPKAIQFAKDSQCGCDMGMVCCGEFNNKSYMPLINCAAPEQPEKLLLSSISDESVCGLETSTNKIKGGTAVAFDEFPWLSVIEYMSKLTKKNAGLRCGGSIINQRYILTAAHCILHVEFMIIKVWLGVTNTTSGKYCRKIRGKIKCIQTVQKINVENEIPHEFYDPLDKFNDIGLLRLEHDIEFSNFIRPICLPSPDSETPKIETHFTVAGWGTTESGEVSDIKLKVVVPLKDNNICNEYLKNANIEITSKQLCVGGERGKDSCEGDSGGPLMYEFQDVNDHVRWYQQGIVSFGNGCGIQGRPGVYSKVSSYVRWIASKINVGNYGLVPDEPCMTIYHTTGTCVSLNTCEEVSKAVSTKSKHELIVVLQSQCGGENNDGAVVCCENPGSIIIPNWNSTALPNKTTCGILKTKPASDGIEIKDLAEFPWVAGIELSHKNSNINEIRRIGTVIHSRYVLTSAKGLFRNGSTPINVWLGHWNTSAYIDCKKISNTVDCTNPVQKIKIKTTITHPFSYRDGNSSTYDIALIFLENEIKFSDYISPICLPLPILPKLKHGTRMTTLRWIKYTTGLINTSDMMLKADIPSVSDDKCNMILTKRNIPDLNSLQMCAGGEGQHSCSRLPGAPLMRSYKDKSSGRTQWYLEGLVNFISDECRTTLFFEGYPGSYTRVSKYLDWIINIISEN